MTNIVYSWIRTQFSIGSFMWLQPESSISLILQTALQHEGPCGWQHNIPSLPPGKDVHVLIPWACDHIRLHDKRMKVADGVKVASQLISKRLFWWILVGPVWSQESLKEEESRRASEKVMWLWKENDQADAVVALKTEQGGQEPRKAGGLLKLEKARKQTTSLLPKRGTVLLTPWF